MITSNKGKEMLLTVSPIYTQNKVMSAIFQAIGTEADLSEELSEDVSSQLFVQTATWGLDFWEDAVGLPINKSKAFKDRRIEILTKMQTRYPVTPNRIKRVVESMTEQVVDIIQNVADYTFLVSFANSDIINVNFLDVLEEIKPAHLSYRVESRIERVVKIVTNISYGFSLFPLCNTIAAGEWPYQQNVGKWNYANVLAVTKNKDGTVPYKDTATIAASEKVYEEHLFATQATHKSIIKPILSYIEREVGYVEANEVVSGRYPYAVIEGKVIDTGSVIKASLSGGKSRYSEVATITSSEKLYEEYAFAEITDFEFGMTSRHHVSLRELEYKKPGDVVTGDYPYTKNLIKVQENRVTEKDDSKIGISAYKICGETYTEEDS